MWPWNGHYENYRASEDYCLQGQAPRFLHGTQEKIPQNFLNMLVISMAMGYVEQYQMNDKLVVCMFSFCFFCLCAWIG
jgi:hypothetical protein